MWTQVELRTQGILANPGELPREYQANRELYLTQMRNKYNQRTQRSLANFPWNQVAPWGWSHPNSMYVDPSGATELSESWRSLANFPESIRIIENNRELYLAQMRTKYTQRTQRSLANPHGTR